jgi:gliding motility-associated-like protein
MRNILSAISSAILLIGLSSSVSAQVTFTVQPAADLVQNVLVGAGVQVSNITTLGDPNQVGRFIGGNSVGLGLPNGIVMTTGNIPAMMDEADPFSFIGAPANPGSLSTSGFNTINSVNDPDLNEILQSLGVLQGFPNLTNNVSVIEFDFIPSGDSLKFSYVFGSEEYNSYVCSDFFDAFGFFLSGPGINGTYTNNAINLALVPGTNLPVGINTINDGVSDQGACPPGGLNNTQFYVDNSAAQNFAIVGTTTPLLCEAQVICGETYHIKLVIANGSDTSLDSWVFLESESFSSSVPAVNIANLLPDSAVIEGCIEGQLVFRRNLSTDTLVIPVFYSGEASNGDDYLGLPDTLTFLPGVDSLYYVLQPVDDGIAEGTNGYESLIIAFQVINQCGETIFVERELKIRDPYLINLQPLSDTLDCPQANYTVGLIPSNGYAPYNYQWANNGQITPTINVPITESQTFPVSVTDALNCPNSPFLDTVVVTLNYDTITSISQDIIICSGDTINIDALTENGLLPHNIAWSNGLNTDTISVTATDTTVFTYTATDACGISVIDSFVVNVPVFDTLIVTTNDTIICSKDSEAALISYPEGGAGGYTYIWTGPQPINATNDSLSVAGPTVTSTYFIQVTDQCGVTAFDSMEVAVQNCDLKASNAFSPNGDGKNDFFTIQNIEYFPGSIVYLYSRWGKKVFEQTDYKNNWSGDDALISGTYFYVVEPNDGTEPLKGYVMVFKE